VDSSSWVPSSSAAASANHSFGGRGGSDRLAGGQVDDGLDVDREALPGDEPLDLGGAGADPLQFDLLPPQLRRQLEDDVVHHVRRHARAAVGDPVDRVDDVVACRALDEIADGAGAEHLEHRRAVLERRQRDHPRPWGVPDDLPCRPRAASRRHAHVDERDVGLFPLGERHRFVRVGRRADEGERGLLREQRGERFAKRGLVVGEEDAHMRIAAQGKRGAHEG
jgi:hypothetical protein